LHLSARRALNQPCDVALAEVMPWSPDAPTLYDLDIPLRSGDRVTSYFGVCRIEIRRTPQASTGYS
jgi:beta-galactosidase/beta-glucuronidase